MDRFPAVAVGLAFALMACDDGGTAYREPEPVDAVVDFSASRQHITGFGASSAWTARAMSDALADRFFSAESGIGLSLLRVRITPAGTTDELETARKARARGASVWAAPWSPPGEWKTNGDAENGGSLLPQHRGAWAERLAAFAQAMKAEDVPLVALSAQNEPNWTASWETCRWSEAELAAFVRDDLGPALERVGLDTPILAPETNGWGSIRSFGDALVEDAEARRFLGAIATHSYGGVPAPYDGLAAHGLEFWQSEMGDPVKTPDDGMASAVRVAQLVSEHLTVAGVNAWHYWWLLPNGTDPDNQALATTNGDDAVLVRRAHAIGNYSKFVRPGFVRVESTPRPQMGVTVTAFRSPDADRYVIVATNARREDVSQRFVAAGRELVSVTPWETSDAFELARLPEIAVDPDGFTYVLPRESVTTFVGELR